MTAEQIIPVYQAFGGGGYRAWTLPKAAQEEEILGGVGCADPDAVFDFAYSWGKQSSDHALVNTADLRAVFVPNNASPGRGGAWTGEREVRISAFLGLCGVLAAGLLLRRCAPRRRGPVPRRDAARPGGEEWASRYGAAGPCLLERGRMSSGCVIPVAEPGVPAQPCSPTGATRPCIIQVSGTGLHARAPRRPTRLRSASDRPHRIQPCGAAGTRPPLAQVRDSQRPM